MYNFSKKTILVQLGPLHLCQTTGLPLIECLSKENRVIIYAPRSLENENWLWDQCHRFPKNKVCWYSDRNSHELFFLKQEIRQLSAFVDALFIPNHSWPINQVLIHSVKKLNPLCSIIVYQNGKFDTSNGAEDQIRRDTEIARAFPKLSLYSKLAWLFNLIFSIYYKLINFYFFKLLPLIYFGKFFSPPCNFKTGRYSSSGIKQFNALNSVFYFYDDVALDYARKIGFKNAKHEMHPVSKLSPKEINNIFGFERNHEQRSDATEIVILPSWGFTSAAEIRNQQDIFANSWFEVVTLLKMKYDNPRIAIKLHPNAKDDPLWKITCQKLNQEASVAIIESSESAEALVLRSDVICGDISSILLWASFFPKKHIISFDLFHLNGADEFAPYSTIDFYNRDRLNFELSQIG